LEEIVTFYDIHGASGIKCVKAMIDKTKATSVNETFAFIACNHCELTRTLTSWLPEFNLTVSHTTHLSYRIQINDDFFVHQPGRFFHQKNITTTKIDPTLPQPTCLKGGRVFKSSNVMNFHPRSEDPTGIAVLGLLAGSCPAFSMESLTPWDTCESIHDV